MSEIKKDIVTSHYITSGIECSCIIVEYPWTSLKAQLTWEEELAENTLYNEMSNRG